MLFGVNVMGVIFLILFNESLLLSTHKRIAFRAMELIFFPVYLSYCIFNSTNGLNCEKPLYTTLHHAIQAVAHTYTHTLKLNRKIYRAIQSFCGKYRYWWQKIQSTKRKCEKQRIHHVARRQKVLKKRKVIKSSNEWQIKIYNSQHHLIRCRCKDISSNDLKARNCECLLLSECEW